MVEVDLSVEPLWGEDSDWQDIAERAVAIAFKVADIRSPQSRVNVSIRFADNAEVQILNRDYRHKDVPTNVLSFPMLDASDLRSLRTLPAGSDEAVPDETLLGDVILAHETCNREALEKGIILPNHVSHLIIHGTLHLLGYDHIDDNEAAIMEALEVKALASMGLGNPYSD